MQRIRYNDRGGLGTLSLPWSKLGKMDRTGYPILGGCWVLGLSGTAGERRRRERSPTSGGSSPLRIWPGVNPPCFSLIPVMIAGSVRSLSQLFIVTIAHNLMGTGDRSMAGRSIGMTWALEGGCY